MARIINGITGQFQGKVGTVVGATWKGIPYMRSLPKKRTGPISEKESANRLKFAMAHSWLVPVKKFVREGFKGYTPTVEGFLAAKSYLLKNAFEEKDGEKIINPALVKLSHGSLPLPSNIQINMATPGKLLFSWDSDNTPFDNRFDQAMVLAYDIKGSKAAFELTGQFRSGGAHAMTIIPGSEPANWHCYIAFVAADRSRQSHSVYLGTITI